MDTPIEVLRVIAAVVLVVTASVAARRPAMKLAHANMILASIFAAVFAASVRPVFDLVAGLPMLSAGALLERYAIALGLGTVMGVVLTWVLRRAARGVNEEAGSSR